MRDPKTGMFPKGNGSGRGGPAEGHGWGGPPKGASTSRIKPGDPDGIQAMSNDPDVIARAELRREKVLQMYEAIVDDVRQQAMIRIVAGDKLLNRIEGLPVARNLNTNVGDPSLLTDAELAAIAAAGRAAPVAPDTEQPGDAVH